MYGRHTTMIKDTITYKNQTILTLYHKDFPDEQLVNASTMVRLQTMRLRLKYTPLFYERRGFLHSSGRLSDHGIK